MSNNNGSDNTLIWIFCGAIVALATLIGMFSPNDASTAPASYDSPPQSFEYRYARERFKQEGYSSSDADTAARAVYKFHQAQQSRK